MSDSENKNKSSIVSREFFWRSFFFFSFKIKLKTFSNTIRTSIKQNHNSFMET